MIFNFPTQKYANMIKFSRVQAATGHRESISRFMRNEIYVREWKGE